MLVDGETGVGTFVGAGPAYFLTTLGRLPTTCEEGKPLSWGAPGVAVWRWNSSDAGAARASFDFGGWAPRGGGGTNYSLTVTDGELRSSQPGGSPY